jgi:hypothetical protein
MAWWFISAGGGLPSHEATAESHVGSHAHWATVSLRYVPIPSAAATRETATTTARATRPNDCAINHAIDRDSRTNEVD